MESPKTHHQHDHDAGGFTPTLKSGDQFKFSIKWWYNINNHVENRGRSGYEYFPKDGNRAYVIAQFFPRLAVYNDVEGWQNHQFWGNGEFALNFGDYTVRLTVPADHVVEATGQLQNPKMFSLVRNTKGIVKPKLLLTNP